MYKACTTTFPVPKHCGAVPARVSSACKVPGVPAEAAIPMAVLSRLQCSASRNGRSRDETGAASFTLNTSTTLSGRAERDASTEIENNLSVDEVRRAEAVKVPGSTTRRDSYRTSGTDADYSSHNFEDSQESIKMKPDDIGEHVIAFLCSQEKIWLPELNSAVRAWHRSDSSNGDDNSCCFVPGTVIDINFDLLFRPNGEYISDTESPPACFPSESHESWVLSPVPTLASPGERARFERLVKVEVSFATQTTKTFPLCDIQPAISPIPYGLRRDASTSGRVGRSSRARRRAREFAVSGDEGGFRLPRETPLRRKTHNPAVDDNGVCEHSEDSINLIRDDTEIGPIMPGEFVEVQEISQSHSCTVDSVAIVLQANNRNM